MTRDKKDLDALTAGGMEAEADLDRHHMEEAILATVAAAGAECYRALVREVIRKVS